MRAETIAVATNVVSRYFHLVSYAGDVDTIRSCFASNAELNFVGLPPMRGTDAVRRFVEAVDGLRANCHYVNHRITNLWVDGDDESPIVRGYGQVVSLTREAMTAPTGHELKPGDTYTLHTRYEIHLSSADEDAQFSRFDDTVLWGEVTGTAEPHS